MPDPIRYKNKEKFMKSCLHKTIHKEHKDKEVGLAQCLNMWRDEHGGKKPPKSKKSSTSGILRIIAGKLNTYA